MILPDILHYNLNIVFCGTAAGNKSAERKAYYAGRGNLFYLTLASCGFTPRLFQADEFRELLNHKIGLTDLAKFTHGIDKDLLEEDYDTENFEEKILLYQPKVVCFNGKKAAKVYLQLMDTKQILYGEQDRLIGKTKLFVAPSTSFNARKYWDENIWRQLKNICSNENQRHSFESL
jgi:TDG/mug DNA glycosylase family protein